jgi:hypothetical protein
MSTAYAAKYLSAKSADINISVGLNALFVGAGGARASARFPETRITRDNCDGQQLWRPGTSHYGYAKASKDKGNGNQKEA